MNPRIQGRNFAAASRLSGRSVRRPSIRCFPGRFCPAWHRADRTRLRFRRRGRPLFSSDPTLRHRAAYAPGEHFRYCNLGYQALGQLAWTLDGRELPEVIRKRILEPLGMTQSEPVITLDIHDRLVKNYSLFQNDRPECARCSTG